MSADLDARAIEILRENDRGGYTIPTRGLYPYQWNWDSAFCALGWATFDVDRAWRELETLLEGQWPNGMVPHIVFRRDDPDYFPGPSVWGTDHTPPTSGHSQPPVLATVLRHLVESDPDLASDRLRALFPKALAWHRWFHEARDPEQLGVIAISHPWESGRDNLPDWDGPLAAVDISGVAPYQRRDTRHVDASMRPTKADYDRYVALVQLGRERGWSAAAIARDSPFWVADVGITAILLRADRDLLALAEGLGDGAAAAEIGAWIGRAEAGFERLWNPDLGAFCTLDLRSGRLADGISAATFLAFDAEVAEDGQAERLIGHLRRWLEQVRFAVPSYDPAHPAFDPLRYWRGPVWAIVNWMIARGLARSGHDDLALRVRADTRALIEGAGFHEYFCPLTGRGCGGDAFSWTAAIWLAWASPSGDR